VCSVDGILILSSRGARRTACVIVKHPVLPGWSLLSRRQWEISPFHLLKDFLLSISISEFFRERELNSRLSIDSVDMLWGLLLEEQVAQEEKVTRIQKLTHSSLFFRGQSNEKYGLSASLHRAMIADLGPVLTENGMYEVEKRIREAAEGLGLGKGVTELEVQKILQHHHAPTRLIDVSRTPMEALFFATEGRDVEDGRLFLIHVDEGTARNQEVSLGEGSDLPWAKYAMGTTRAKSAWTQSVKVVKGRPLDPRMLAQNGVFLVGGMQRKYGNLNVHHDGRYLNAEELQAISTLTIAFRKIGGIAKGRQWPAYGWTIRIEKGWKPELRRRLDDTYKIRHETMYPAFESLQWRAEAAVRESVPPLSVST
jgi:hypothetical protein